MPEVLAISCPNGHVGMRLVPLLYKQNKFKLRLAAHSQSSAETLKKAYPDAEVRSVDLTVLEHCRQLLRGVTSVFHIGPSFHSREKEIGFNMIDAAIEEFRKKGNAFKHFVFSSVLCTQHRSLMQHDLKSYVEERLMLSPLNFTILQPTNFMDAYPIASLKEQESPVLDRLWNAEIPNSLISLLDLAEASAKVLNERETHYLAQYPLCSTMPVSDAEVAREIGKQIGKEVKVRSPDFQTGVDRVLVYLFSKPGGAAGSTAAEGDPNPDITYDEASRLILYYNKHGLNGYPTVLRWLLGRQPTTVAQYVATELQKLG